MDSKIWSSSLINVGIFRKLPNSKNFRSEAECGGGYGVGAHEMCDQNGPKPKNPTIFPVFGYCYITYTINRSMQINQLQSTQIDEQCHQ